MNLSLTSSTTPGDLLSLMIFKLPCSILCLSFWVKSIFIFSFPNTTIKSIFKSDTMELIISNDFIVKGGVSTITPELRTLLWLPSTSLPLPSSMPSNLDNTSIPNWSICRVYNLTFSSTSLNPKFLTTGCFIDLERLPVVVIVKPYPFAHSISKESLITVALNEPGNANTPCLGSRFTKTGELPIFTAYETSVFARDVFPRYLPPKIRTRGPNARSPSLVFKSLAICLFDSMYIARFTTRSIFVSSLRYWVNSSSSDDSSTDWSGFVTSLYSTLACSLFIDGGA